MWQSQSRPGEFEPKYTVGKQPRQLSGPLHGSFVVPVPKRAANVFVPSRASAESRLRFSRLPADTLSFSPSVHQLSQTHISVVNTFSPIALLHS